MNPFLLHDENIDSIARLVAQQHLHKYDKDIIDLYYLIFSGSLQNAWSLYQCRCATKHCQYYMVCKKVNLTIVGTLTCLVIPSLIVQYVTLRIRKCYQKEEASFMPQIVSEYCGKFSLKVLQ